MQSSELEWCANAENHLSLRRSGRVPQGIKKKRIQQELEAAILNGFKDGLQIREMDDKGRGVITTREFYKGEFVVEYEGELVDGKVGKKRDILYKKDSKIGCYLYFFKHRDRQYCLDATEETGKLGRLINHSRNGNLISRVIEVGKPIKPHLIFLARRDILKNEELLYDYGDRNPQNIMDHPWLAH
ncbi:hypothetical protein QAD02_000007 [Eretmocerus hayati]|uniref:Uncharacterized protein n=1 Tax=Eretmocerus hayati TaxID=131215 RepID=A0ACC2ND94_9HYME|nr:hypothetical protein QAD02_000007 [Eretmocerus hayati]